MITIIIYNVKKFKTLRRIEIFSYIIASILYYNVILQ